MLTVDGTNLHETRRQFGEMIPGELRGGSNALIQVGERHEGRT
jgi:hypothetical protein